MASRSNMAAWSGCVTHRDIIYKTEGKYQSVYFVNPPVTKHTYSGTKGQFFNHNNVQLCRCNRPLPLLSVLYNDIDDYRGGWKKRGAVDDDVTWMRFQSCPPGREEFSRAGVFLFHQFPLPQKSHVQHTRDKQHVWFRQKIKRKKEKKKIEFLIRQKSSKWWWWALVTVHKKSPDVCGNPCLVVPFVPKLLAHQICSLFQRMDVNAAPRCNGSRVIVKNLGTRSSFLSPWPFAGRPIRRNIRGFPGFIWWLRRTPPRGTFHCKYTVVFFDITVVTWLRILLLQVHNS